MEKFEELSFEEMVEVDGGLIPVIGYYAICGLYIAGTCAAAALGYNAHTRTKL